MRTANASELSSGHNSSEPGYSSVSLADLQDYQRRTTSFDLFGIFQPGEFSLTSPGSAATPERSGSHPRTGLEPWRQPRSGPLVRLGLRRTGESHSRGYFEPLWKRLGGNPDILGQTLTMNGKPYTVTGVMPPWFRFPVAFVDGGEYRADVWVPLDPQGPNRNRDVFSYFAYVRLKPGVTFAQADTDVKRVARELLGEYPKLYSTGHHRHRRRSQGSRR